MTCAGKGRIHGSLVPERPGEADVVGCDVVDGGLRGGRGRRVDDRGQYVVVDVDECSGRLGLPERLGDDERNLVAHVTHAALGDDRVLGLLHRGAVGRDDEPPAGQAADRRHILAGEDAEHSRRRARRIGVDAADAGVRVGAAHKEGVALARQCDVVGVLAAPGQESVVLAPLDRAADVGSRGRAHLEALLNVPWPSRPARRHARCSDSPCSGRNCRRAPCGSPPRCRAGGASRGRSRS